MIHLIALISDTIYVVGPASPSVDLGADIDICVGEQTYLTPTVTGGSGPLLTVGAPVSLVQQLSLEVAIIQ